MQELSTTSYAVLGLLALRPWTTYELAKQMGRTLHYFWPRAESRLYEEPKKLVEHGLATMERTFVGRRPRTIYAITPQGRRALAAWLDTPSAGPVLEFEGLIRVFCAASGTKEQLLATITAIREGAEAMQRHGADIAREYLEGRATFPERVHTNALMFDFLWQYSEAILRWARATEAEVEGWDNLSVEGKIEWAMQKFSQPFGEPTKRGLEAMDQPPGPTEGQ